MVSRRMTQMGKWSRRIGGGALVLALVGLLAPATTTARYMEQEEEVIEVEGEAPLTSPWWHGGYTGSGGSSSGGSGGGDGGGGGSSPSSESGTDPLEDCGQYNPFSSDGSHCLNQQITHDCERVFGGTYYWVEEYEFDPNGDVVDSHFLGRCDIETQDGWMQVWYDPQNGSADPVEICSGSPGQPGTCWEP